MSRRLVIGAALAVLSVGVSVWRVKSRAPTFAPVDFPCLGSPAAGWVTAVSDRALLRLEWDGDGGGRVGVAPAGGVVAWNETTETEARRVAREALEPLRRNIGSSPGSVTLLVACDSNMTQWKNETGTVPAYRDCLRGAVRQLPKCLSDVREERNRVVDWRAGGVSERLEAELEKRGVKLPPPPSRGPWDVGAVPSDFIE